MTSFLHNESRLVRSDSAGLTTGLAISAGPSRSFQLSKKSRALALLDRLWRTSQRKRYPNDTRKELLNSQFRRRVNALVHKMTAPR